MGKILQKKLKAYTIIEVTVTMIIASISIVITYTAFNIIQQSYRQFNKKNDLVGELLIVDKLLVKDFLEARVINRKDDGFIVKKDSGIVSYSFIEEYILRNQNDIRMDTFFISTSDPVMTFEKRLVEHSDKVDELSIQLNMSDKFIRLTYNKTYSSEDLYVQDAEHQ